MGGAALLSRASTVKGPGGVDYLLVELDPPAQSGKRSFVLAPRYLGDELKPGPGAPVTVNVLSADQAELLGVGEIYATRAEANATDTEEQAARGKGRG